MHRNVNYFCCFARDYSTYSLTMTTRSTAFPTVTAQVLPPLVPNGSGPCPDCVNLNPLLESQYSSLLSAMQESKLCLDRKLVDFKSDVRQVQDKAATNAINRVWRELWVQVQVAQEASALQHAGGRERPGGPGHPHQH